jgi:hypothetical protein
MANAITYKNIKRKIHLVISAMLVSAQHFAHKFINVNELKDVPLLSTVQSYS